MALTHIVVDLMGSDSSHKLLYEGALKASELLADTCKITVVATQKVLDECFKDRKPLAAVIATQEVLMDESPLLAVRRKKKSSMAIGIKMLKKKECDAFVSAGNTGAITAYSSLELPKLPGISRPALLTELPTNKGRSSVLDVGANISFRPESFFQFALMGAAYQQVKRGTTCPKIGLLNIGAEVRKGTRKIRQAYDYFVDKKEQMLQANLSFEGNVESQDFFSGKVDVLVTDGFTGNVFLKTCEGVSSFILDQMRDRFSQKNNSSEKEGFKELEKYLDYAEYPGAVLVGIEGVVVKCHGSSSTTAMVSGIKGAFSLVKEQVIPQIKTHLEGFQQKFK